MSKTKKKIAAVIVDRANYGRMKPLLGELRDSDECHLQVICAGTMLLERFGRAEDIVKRDGFQIDDRVFVELEGSNPVTMAKSLGLAVNEFTHAYNRLTPDLILVIGDRYEALGAVLAAAYMNLTIVHLQGGEVSGSIDECARHAITKFAHYHFPATKRAGEYLIRMGEDPRTVFNLGCPVADVILGREMSLPSDVFAKGVGFEVRPHDPYFLVMFHPDTTDYETRHENTEELLQALHELRHPTVWLWPNIDAGSDRISRILRQYREREPDTWLRLMKNFEPETFQAVLANATCAIGNSSSFVRDSTFLGTPVVLVGNRQFGRECGENTLKTSCVKSEIQAAISRQLANGRYPPSRLYGEAGAASAIAKQIVTLAPIRRKYLHYVFENP